MTTEEMRLAESAPAVEHAAVALRRLWANMRAAQPAWLDLDLTVGQIRGLFVLAYHGPLTIGQVAEMLHVRLPWASTLVDRLVDLQLVQRAEDPADRRRTLARLTPRGEELIALVHEGGQRQLRACLTRLSAEDLAALIRGLDALNVAAGADGADCV